MTRTFAKDTAVPVSRTRSAIDMLLRDWKCDGIQWTDEFTKGRVTLRFLWTREEMQYAARFTIELPNDEVLKKRAIHRGTYQFSQRKFETLQRDRGKQEHRLLLLWLKAAFNAIEGGIIPAEMLFLPWLEGRDGQTVGEKAIPKLSQLLLAQSANALLLDASDES